MNAKPPVVFLMGPTAAGKTELALRLADRLPADIVSVDSAMVYRGMDIGTAKPGPALRRRYPHRLIDVAEPEEPYSAARFVAGARREIETIHKAGRLPLLVGGTFLYFRALAQGLTELPEADPALRASISAEGQRLGWPALHRRLAVRDPEAAAAIHPRDTQRLQRALEILERTGHGPSYWHHRATPRTNPWAVYRVVLSPANRKQLHTRIENRFQRMLAQGFLSEVRALRARPGMRADLPSMRAVGYRQLWRHLDGECDLSEALYRGIVATRQLAKRQISWLRGQSPAVDLHSSDAAKALESLNKAGLQTVGD